MRRELDNSCRSEKPGQQGPPVTRQVQLYLRGCHDCSRICDGHDPRVQKLKSSLELESRQVCSSQCCLLVVTRQRLRLGQLKFDFEDEACDRRLEIGNTNLTRRVKDGKILESRKFLRKQGWAFSARGGCVVAGREGGSAGSDQFNCCSVASPMPRKLASGTLIAGCWMD